MARLLDERAAGVGGEAVPVADLGAGTGSGARASRPCAACPTAPSCTRRIELGGRRHVAVLETDPRDRRRAGARPSSSIRRSQSATVVHSGFSTSACRSVASTSPTTSMWVWFGVTTTTASHRPLSSRSRWSVERRARRRRRPRGRPRERPGVGVGDRGDDRAVDGADVVDVLDAHHPGADHAVADRRCSLRSCRPANRDRRPAAVPGRCREGHRLCRWPPCRRRCTRRLRAAPVPRRRRARQRVEGGRAPRPRPAVGDGASCRSSSASSACSCSTAARPARRRRRPGVQPGAGVRRGRRPPRSRWSIAARRCATSSSRLVDRRRPATSPTTSCPAGSPTAGLDGVRVDLVEADTLHRRPDRARRRGRRRLHRRPGGAARSAVGGRGQRGDRARSSGAATSVVRPASRADRRPRASVATTLVARADAARARSTWSRPRSPPHGLGRDRRPRRGGRLDGGRALAALNGAGVAFLPRCRVADDVARGDLRASCRSATSRSSSRCGRCGAAPGRRTGRPAASSTTSAPERLPGRPLQVGRGRSPAGRAGAGSRGAGRCCPGPRGRPGRRGGAAARPGSRGGRAAAAPPTSPRPTTGWATVVRSSDQEISWSSNPAIDTSSGTRRPWSRTARMAPMAISSENAKTAVGGWGWSSMRFIAW